MPVTLSGFRRRQLNGRPAFPRAATEDWSTPDYLYRQLHEEFSFDRDPCPLHSTADGLSSLFAEPWTGRRIFVNCPYGPEIGKWMSRAREADLAVFLVPARTDTRWFHEVCLPYAREIRFLRGRLKFGDAKTGAPFPSMVVIFSAANHDRRIEDPNRADGRENPDQQD
jgi:hypothetical protein